MKKLLLFAAIAIMAVSLPFAYAAESSEETNSTIIETQTDFGRPPEPPKDENGNYIRPQGSEFREHLPINSTDSENSN